MSKRECPSCGVEVDEDMINKELNVCPICGYEYPERSKLSKFNIKIVAFILLVLLIYPLVKLLINLLTY